MREERKRERIEEITDVGGDKTSKILQTSKRTIRSPE